MPAPPNRPVAGLMTWPVNSSVAAERAGVRDADRGDQRGAGGQARRVADGNDRHAPDGLKHRAATGNRLPWRDEHEGLQVTAPDRNREGVGVRGRSVPGQDGADGDHERPILARLAPGEGLREGQAHRVLQAPGRDRGDVVDVDRHRTDVLEAASPVGPERDVFLAAAGAQAAGVARRLLDVDRGGELVGDGVEAKQPSCS